MVYRLTVVPVMAPKGRVIFVEGDTSHEAYLLKSGRVDVVRRYRGKRHVPQQPQADEIFGELGLVLEDTRGADAVVLENRACSVIDQIELERQHAGSTRFV